MLKNKCLHPQLSKIIKEMGHTDLFCVTDAGFPIPDNIERVDLAWKPGEAKWLDVCEMLKEEIKIEKIYLAKEIKEKSSEMSRKFMELFEGIPIEWISHQELKVKSKECKAIVRTGEYTSFSNCILQIGVEF